MALAMGVLEVPSTASTPQRPQVGSEASGGGDCGACWGIWGSHRGSWVLCYKIQGKLGNTMGTMGTQEHSVISAGLG